ncbi:N-acetylmuramoyl-L-alanine amidase [Butyrivibrio sp. FCS006]|uniref:N-acetylmuramoyl-L-alanine amidase n=1 Tax=Butyrivibrio sp. FCS006 TaxID=1280684 RepID=UPI0004070F85|nr:N-acetylmuramoyl-L-alanine amidase [Butyrivibrio sp. FCS006]
MTNKEMKKVAIKASVFAIVSISLMLYRSATKHIMITDAAGVQLERGSSENAYTLLVDKNVPQGKSDVLIIPLPKSVSSDNIVLEDRYLDHQLRIYIDSREEGFYKDNAIVTDLDIIEDAVCVAQNDTGSVCLDFDLDNLYANESTLTESSTIEVKFLRPSEKYDRIVAVDTDEGLLETALLLKNIASRDQNNDIKFYYTSQAEEDVSIEQRMALVKDCQADLLVGLSLDDSGNDEGLTCYYNDRFFLRRLNNAQFADIVERNCAVEFGAQAFGVVPAGEDELLLSSSIPSARLKIGIAATGDEAEDPAGKTDMNKVAEGVYNAVLEAFEVME